MGFVEIVSQNAHMAKLKYEIATIERELKGITTAFGNELYDTITDFVDRHSIYPSIVDYIKLDYEKCLRDVTLIEYEKDWKQRKQATDNSIGFAEGKRISWRINHLKHLVRARKEAFGERVFYVIIKNTEVNKGSSLRKVYDQMHIHKLMDNFVRSVRPLAKLKSAKQGQLLSEMPLETNDRVKVRDGPKGKKRIEM